MELWEPVDLCRCRRVYQLLSVTLVFGLWLLGYVTMAKMIFSESQKTTCLDSRNIWFAVESFLD